MNNLEMLTWHCFAVEEKLAVESCLLWASSPSALLAGDWQAPVG